MKYELKNKGTNMNKIYALLVTVLMAITVNVASAATVEIEWKNPENYQDIASGNTQSKNKFQKKLFRTLEKSFNENMLTAPSGYKLKITMIDIDLAGKINRGLSNEIRMITDHDFPRLHFYAILENSKGEIVLQGEQNLKERKDKHKSFRMKGSQSDFYLETDLLNKWFQLALLPKLGIVKS